MTSQRLDPIPTCSNTPYFAFLLPLPFFFLTPLKLDRDTLIGPPLSKYVIPWAFDHKVIEGLVISRNVLET